MEIGSPELEESIWVLVNDLQWPLGLGPADVALVWIEDHPLVFEVPAEKKTCQLKRIIAEGFRSNYASSG